MTKRMMLVVVACVVTITTLANAAEPPVKLNLKSFHSLVLSDDIEEFKIYKSHTSKIDATAKDKSGNIFIVDRPYHYAEDDIFIEYLKMKDVSLTILDEPYKGELPDDVNSMKWAMMLGSMIYLIPIFLIIAIVIMARTIGRQSKTIASLVEKSQQGS